MAEYAGRLPLFHIDLYRLADGVGCARGRSPRRTPGERRHPRRVAGADGGAAAGGPSRRGDRGTGADDVRTITIRALDPSLARYLEAAAVSGADGATRRAAAMAPRDRHRDEPRRRRRGRAGRNVPRRDDLGGRLSPRRAAPAGDRQAPRRAQSPSLADRRDRRRDGPGRIHRAPRRDRDRQGPRPRPRSPDRRRVERRGAHRGGGGRWRAPAQVALLLPAGPSDRIVVRAGQPPALLPGGIDPELVGWRASSSPSISTAGRRPTRPPAGIARGTAWRPR